MEDKNPKNNFDHPAVIVTALILVFVGGYFLLNKNQNPQQSEIDALKTEVENLKNSNIPNSSGSSSQKSGAVSKQKSLTEIAQEWRKSTAYVECYWQYKNTSTWYLKESGSGLLVMLNSVPTVITNRHVVDSPQYGVAQECDVGFPDSNSHAHVFYSVTTVDHPAYVMHIATGIPDAVIPDNPIHGQIKVASDGNDVAYLSDLKEGNADLVPPTISLNNRARSGHFFCDKNPLQGDSIAILGYPSYGTNAGTFMSVISQIDPTVTEGIISGQDGIYLTTSAKIEHGNSGGLVIDEKNDCYVGIPTAAVAGEIESLGRILPASYIVN